MKLKKILKEIFDQHGLEMTKKGLHYGQAPNAKRLMQPFLIIGLGRNTDGCIVGILIGHDGKLCLVPMAAVREPKKLGDCFEPIGLVVPTELAELKLLAKYIDKVGRHRKILVIQSEGVHRVVRSSGDTFVAAITDSVYGDAGRKAIPVLAAPSVYAARGNLTAWNEAFATMLQENPLMMMAICFALSAPLTTILDVKPLFLLITGPSSTGKTTLAKLVMSTYGAPGEPHQWSATGNGIEALAMKYRDLPLVVDELGSGGARAALEGIYRVSGGNSKARATRTGSLQAPEVIRSPIFATGEVTLHHHANRAGEAMRMGHEARMPTILVNEAHGVFSELGDAATGAEISARVMASIKAQYGTVMPAFIKALLDDTAKTQRRAAKLRSKMEADIAGCDVITLSGLEKRVLDGFLNCAIAGELAIRFGILALPRGTAKKAIAHVYQQWLERWRGSSSNELDAPVVSLRNELKAVMNDFVPLADWQEKGTKRTPGYTKLSSKFGKLYLVHPPVFQRMCGNHDPDTTIRALRHHDFLVTDREAKTKLFRMPGRAQGEEGDRMAFHAIRESIIFDK